MPLRLAVILCLSTMLASCSEDPAFAAAKSSLAEFQRGLQQGDRALLRKSVTSRSREYVSKLPRRASKVPLKVLAQKRENSRIYLDVVDESPDAPVQQGCFVIAKENGSWLVDLIATAGQSAREVANKGQATRLVRTKVSQEQVEAAARVVEASMKKKR